MRKIVIVVLFLLIVPTANATVTKRFGGTLPIFPCSSVTVDWGPTSAYGTNVALTVQNSGGQYWGDVQFTAGTTIHWRLNLCGQVGQDVSEVTPAANVVCTQHWTIDPRTGLGAYDQFGHAILACPAGHATGAGHFEKLTLNSVTRWFHIDALGNPGWMVTIQNSEGPPGPSGVNAVLARDAILAYLGFNGLGSYASTQTGVGAFSNVFPPANCGTTAAVGCIQLPFEYFPNPGLSGTNSNPGVCGITTPLTVKIIESYIPTTLVGDKAGRGLADPYDSNLSACAYHELLYWHDGDGFGASHGFTTGLSMLPQGTKSGCVTNAQLANCAALYRTYIQDSDADALSDFKGTGNGNVVSYPHPGYLCAVAQFWDGLQDNPKLGCKNAWITQLKAEYGTIGALNTAWGTSSFYTSFDDIPATHTAEVEFAVGSRTIIAYSGMERSNSTTTDSSCAPRGSGSCVGVWVHYNGPCDANTLIVSQSVTISGSTLNPAWPGDSASMDGTFTVSAVLNGTGPSSYPCQFMYAQNKAAYQEGGSTASVNAFVQFTEAATEYKFNIPSGPITPSSLTITIPGLGTATDNGSGTLTGANVLGGSTVDYNGPVDLKMNAAPTSGQNITATYTGNGYCGISGATCTSTSVMDENGHNAWFCGPSGQLACGMIPASPMPAALIADLDTFLQSLATQWGKTTIAAYRQIDPSGAVVWPTSFSNYGIGMRTATVNGLKAAGYDAMELNYTETRPAGTSITGDPVGLMTHNKAIYDLSGLPAIIWYGMGAGSPDSPYLQANYVYGSSSDVFTQSGRAAQFKSDITNFLTTVGTDGTSFVFGIDQWAVPDSDGEVYNWGVMTSKGNPYNGVATVTGAGSNCGVPLNNTAVIPIWSTGGTTVKIPQVSTCGGEAGNYGDFFGGAGGLKATLAAIYTTVFGAAQ